MGIRLGVAAAAVAAVAWTAGARAATVSYSDSFGDVYPLAASGGVSLYGSAPVEGTVDLFGAAQQLTLPKFDPGLGSLTGVSLQVRDVAADALIFLELTGFAGPSAPTAQVSGSSSSRVATSFSVPLTGWLGNSTGPTDGAILFDASGPDGGLGFTTTLSYLQRGIDFLVTFTAGAPDLPSFVGAASFFDVFFDLTLHYDVDCSSTSSSNCRVETSMTDRPAWTGEATVTYVYDPALRVSEPATLPLLAFGLIGLAAMARRR